MKDIGSIFPLYNRELETITVIEGSCQNNYLAYYSLCREALYVIANDVSSDGRVVLLPAYTCSTVVDPFKAAGWRCLYFPVDLSLRIDIKAVNALYDSNNVSLILVHPYFGMDLNDEEIDLLESLHQDGCKVIVDLTQCIFSDKKYEFADYVVGSYRKWYEVPDGSFLKANVEIKGINSGLSENEDFVSLQTDSMYLRGLYFETGNEEVKNISRRLNKRAVDLIKERIEPHAMSAFSLTLMKTIDFDNCKRRRMTNYRYLFDNLRDSAWIQLACDSMDVVTTAPLYFVIYVKDRSELQFSFAAEHIYAPVIWPVPNREVLVNESVKSIYDTVLAIPVDQRYDISDMEKIIRTINKHYNE